MAAAVTAWLAVNDPLRMKIQLDVDGAHGTRPRADEGLSRRDGLAVASFQCLQRVADQGGDGHRANTAGDRGDPAGAFGGGRELDIADQSPVREAVNADVDDNRVRTYPFAGDQFWLADPDHEDLSRARSEERRGGREWRMAGAQ